MILLLTEVDYRIMIKTGDENDAGTDANVHFQMFGEKGKTQNFSLREEGDKKRFERGRMDKFLIRTQDIGKVILGLVGCGALNFAVVIIVVVVFFFAYCCFFLFSFA